MIARPDWDTPIVYTPDLGAVDEEPPEVELTPLDRRSVELAVSEEEVTA